MSIRSEFIPLTNQCRRCSAADEMLGKLPSRFQPSDHAAAGRQQSLPDPSRGPRGNDTIFTSLPRRRSPMRFVRFVAAKKIHRPITAFDRAANHRQIRKSPGLLSQCGRFDAGLVGVRGAWSGQMVFGSDRPAVEFQPAHLQGVGRQQARRNFAMKNLQTDTS